MPKATTKEPKPSTRPRKVARKPAPTLAPQSTAITPPAPSTRSRQTSPAIPAQAQSLLASLKARSSPSIRNDMAPRYGIHTDKAFGVSMANIQKLAKPFQKSASPARNHALAEALWKTGWYEARLLASLIDDPALVTPAQMDRWCRDFDNWGMCDTVCFHLFDRTPHAFDRIAAWSGSKHEFIKRAAFALLASVALHTRRLDTPADDQPYIRSLTLIERAATDDRNFVKKGVSWALRSIGRRSLPLHAASITLAQQLAASPNAVARWIGKDALRDLSKPSVTRRLTAKAR